MTQPPPYTRGFSYAGFSTSFPAGQQPGVSLDGDLDGVGTTLAAVLANLALIQRDDGKLANQSVTLDALSPSALLALGAGGSWLPRGAWVTARAYALADVVSQGTGSYVCAAAHTSGVFATDTTAGKWIKLFDDFGTIPANGSVTASKLALGAVTNAAIGFTYLDLSGYVRAGGGIIAGTAPTGLVLHAKLDAGDVLPRIERLTNTQGAVGFEIVGPSSIWRAAMAVGSASLSFSYNGTLVASLTGEGIDGLSLRATDGAHPTTGVGAGLSFVGGIGYLRSFNAATNAWRELKVQGSITTITASGVDVLIATGTGVSLPIPLAGDSGGVPPGAIFHFAFSAAPAGYLECNGAAISRTFYNHLFAAIGTSYGIGDGTTTFNLPDLRGEFIRGYDHGRGADAGRTFASAQSESVGPHNHTASVPYSSANQVWSGGGANFFGSGPSTLTTNNNTGLETRPRNVALLVCIKY